MQIEVIAVGGLGEKFLKNGETAYLKRLLPYARVAVREVPDLPVKGSFSRAELEQVKEEEGRRVLTKLPPNFYKVSLDRRGKELTSRELADFINKLTLSGQSRLVFIIGGTLGLSPAVLQRSDFIISFSRLTFPHQLIRLLLLEQLFRSFKIIRGEPYHR